jgi:glutaredoxin
MNNPAYERKVAVLSTSICPYCKYCKAIDWLGDVDCERLGRVSAKVLCKFYEIKGEEKKK